MLKKPFLLPDYSTARKHFTKKAEARGFRLESYPIDARGPNGEELASDAAILGSENPDRAVIISSGMHGVEGFFGSAVQLAWLEKIGANWSPPSDCAMILVHAINPYGFAWRRRWNENNVDLNRNFFEDLEKIEENYKEYEKSLRIYETNYTFLNPPSPPPLIDLFVIKAVFQILYNGILAVADPDEKKISFWSKLNIYKLGFDRLDKNLPVGQKKKKKGLFYGGRKPEQSTKIIKENLPLWVGDAHNLLHLDLHTGLGKKGECTMIVFDDENKEYIKWVKAHFHADKVESWGGETAYEARGTIGEFFSNEFKGKNRVYHSLTAEFGSKPKIQVTKALRAENRAHFHTNHDGRLFRRAKKRLMEAFCPSHSKWREKMIKKGVELIDQAVSACFKAAVD